MPQLCYAKGKDTVGPSSVTTQSAGAVKYANYISAEV